MKQKILVYDSGVGGVSVLREAVKLLPYEDFLYFGDTKNAPYGEKTAAKVRQITLSNVSALMSENLKAIVIACNTATSAAITNLREIYKDIPVIGVEPAVKPAVEAHPGGNIIVMATPVTLRETKFMELCSHFKNDANIISLSCAGLMNFVEKGIFSGDELNSYLRLKLKTYLPEGIDAIVLGCTHYPFLKEAISSAAGGNVDIIDGSHGTAAELKRRLEASGQLETEAKGNVEFRNSRLDSTTDSLARRLCGR